MSWSIPWRTELADASLPSKPTTPVSLARGHLAEGATFEANPGIVSLEELVKRAQAGDREAFGLVYERSAPAVHGLLRASLAQQQCEDLHQEIFVAAWVALPRFDVQQAFTPWVYGIARNLLRQRLRELARRRTHSQVMDELPAEASVRAAVPTADQADVARKRAERALQHLHRLPEAEREILGLRIIEGMSAQAIAQLLQSTPGSVRVRVHRALQRLRRLCQEDSP